ncbi:UNVERIFIED_CONTAM: Calcium-activated potassium channel subunit alpha-1 [Gekko kuhli]
MQLKRKTPSLGAKLLAISNITAEKKWFTDESDNAYPRNIQIKPMSTHMANQINQYKSTSSLIPPIREVEDEC